MVLFHFLLRGSFFDSKFVLFGFEGWGLIRIIDNNFFIISYMVDLSEAFLAMIDIGHPMLKEVESGKKLIPIFYMNLNQRRVHTKYFSHNSS